MSYMLQPDATSIDMVAQVWRIGIYMFTLCTVLLYTLCTEMSIAWTTCLRRIAAATEHVWQATEP